MNKMGKEGFVPVMMETGLISTILEIQPLHSLRYNSQGTDYITSRGKRTQIVSLDTPVSSRERIAKDSGLKNITFCDLPPTIAFLVGK